MLIAEIKRAIAERPARSAWDKGCREYAEELFAEVVEHRHLTDDAELGENITEVEMLNGACDWSQYSYGGCALVFDGDICERLYSPSRQRKLHDGAYGPGGGETWLDVQAKALKQAARIVRRVANRRD